MDQVQYSRKENMNEIRMLKTFELILIHQLILKKNIEAVLN